MLPTVEDEDEMVLELTDLPSHPLVLAHYNGGTEGRRGSASCPLHQLEERRGSGTEGRRGSGGIPLHQLEERRGSGGIPLHQLEERRGSGKEERHSFHQLEKVEEGRESPDQEVTLPSGAKNLILEQMAKVSFDDSATPLHMPRPYLPALSMSRIQSRRGSILDVTDWPISVQLFQHCFPFHIIFDRDLIIHYMGVSLARLLPMATRALITDYFDLERPKMEFSYQNIRTSLHNNFVIVTKPSALVTIPVSNRGLLYFRGQMVLTSKRDGAPILFLCSPRVNSMEDLEHQGLYLSDIPVHDVTRDLLLLNRHFIVEMTIAKELEETKKDLVIQKACVEHEKQRADQLLHTMLPPSVANELKGKGEATAIHYSSVTILFSDIKGFTTICNSCRPMQVVGMLNALYTLFDHQSDHHKVYKVSSLLEASLSADRSHNNYIPL